MPHPLRYFLSVLRDDSHASGKVLACEFGYDEKLLPTIPFLDPAIERGMWWTLKVQGLMPMYDHGMLTGLIYSEPGPRREFRVRRNSFRRIIPL